MSTTDFFGSQKGDWANFHGLRSGAEVDAEAAAADPVLDLDLLRTLWAIAEEDDDSASGADRRNTNAAGVDRLSDGDLRSMTFQQMEAALKTPPAALTPPTATPNMPSMYSTNSLSQSAGKQLRLPSPMQSPPEPSLAVGVAADRGGSSAGAASGFGGPDGGSAMSQAIPLGFSTSGVPTAWIFPPTRQQEQRQQPTPTMRPAAAKRRGSGPGAIVLPPSPPAQQPSIGLKSYSNGALPPPPPYSVSVATCGAMPMNPHEQQTKLLSPPFTPAAPSLSATGVTSQQVPTGSVSQTHSYLGGPYIAFGDGTKASPDQRRTSYPVVAAPRQGVPAHIGTAHAQQQQQQQQESFHWLQQQIQQHQGPNPPIVMLTAQQLQALDVASVPPAFVNETGRSGGVGFPSGPLHSSPTPIYHPQTPPTQQQQQQQMPPPIIAGTMPCPSYAAPATMSTSSHGLGDGTKPATDTQSIIAQLQQQLQQLQRLQEQEMAQKASLALVAAAPATPPQQLTPRRAAAALPSSESVLSVSGAQSTSASAELPVPPWQEQRSTGGWPGRARDMAWTSSANPQARAFGWMRKESQWIPIFE